MTKLTGAAVYGCVLLLLACAAPAAAQLDTATVIGVVTDAQGGVIPGATITATNRNSGFVRAATSDAEGRYRLAALTPGRYEVVAELQGFSRALRDGLTFSLGSETVLNFSLQLGTLSEAVTVTAERQSCRRQRRRSRRG